MILHSIQALADIVFDPRMSDAEAERRIQEANGRRSRETGRDNPPKPSTSFLRPGPESPHASGSGPLIEGSDDPA